MYKQAIIILDKKIKARNGIYLISKEALYSYSDNKENVEMVNDVGENVQASAIQDDVMMSWL